jgi:hypothetical protein
MRTTRANHDDLRQLSVCIASIHRGLGNSSPGLRHDPSLKTYVITTTGAALWLLYGAVNADWPLIAANTISLGLTLSILFLKFRYG